MHEAAVNLVEVDYPRDGIFEKGWIKLTPDMVSSWRAFVLESESYGENRGYFLGDGETDLSICDYRVGEFQLKCIQGYVYLVSEVGIAAMPCSLCGYSQVTAGVNVVVFANYKELLVIHADGVVRYINSLVVDNLEVVSLDEERVELIGMRRFGGDDEQWSLALEEIPVVEVTFL